MTREIEKIFMGIVWLILISFMVSALAPGLSGGMKIIFAVYIVFIFVAIVLGIIRILKRIFS